MNVSPLFISHTQTPPLEEPLEAGFDHVTKHAKSATVIFIAARDRGFDAALSQGLADFLFGVVSPISEHFIGTTPRATARLLDRRNCVHQFDGTLRIVNVGSGVLDRQRHTIGISDQMTLRATLTAIRGIRPCFLPPKTARTEQLSMTAHERLIWPASPSSLSNISQIACHTPSCCQSRSRRQHVMPHPQPSSCGRYSQGQPVFSTNRIPVRQARSETRGRPPLGFGGSGGNSGRIRSHNASGNNGLAMRSSLTRVRDASSPRTYLHGEFT